MHIKFDDENLLIQNLQIFLKENYDRQLLLSGVYDINTHKALIGYLKKPNTADVREVKSRIIKEFTYRESSPPHQLVDGGGIFNFDNKITTDEIVFYTKPRSTFFDAGMDFIGGHIEELKSLVLTMGWTVVDYTRFTYTSNSSVPDKAFIRIKKTGIKNVFPNKTVLPMVNLFDGTYFYNKCFLDERNNYEGYIQTNPNYKIAAIACEPGDTFTIAHGYGTECEMAFAYTSASLKQLRTEEIIPIDAENILSRMSYSAKGMISPGRWEYYTIPEDSDAQYLLVQVPYRSDLVSAQTRTSKIKRGDINGDGVVDKADVDLLNEWVIAKENNSNPPFEMTGTTLLAANVTGDLDLDGNPIISRDDVTVLQAAVESGIADQWDDIEFQQQVRVSEYELDRLLVMYGDDAKDETLNIPIASFYEETWAVHEKFVEYFLGRVIHKYSPMMDIEWLHEQVNNYTGITNSNTGKYDEPEDYVTDDYIAYDATTTKWKYYRGKTYVGYYLDTSSDVQNGIIRNDNGTKTSMEVIKGRLYINGDPDGRMVLSDGRIANLNSDTSLRQLVKNIQQLFNNAMEIDGIAPSERICWADGYFDNQTERELFLAIDGHITYDHGAFR